MVGGTSWAVAAACFVAYAALCWGLHPWNAFGRAGLPVEMPQVSFAERQVRALLRGDPNIVWERSRDTVVSPVPGNRWELSATQHCVEVWVAGNGRSTRRIFESFGCVSNTDVAALLVPLPDADLQDVVSGMDRLALRARQTWIANSDAWRGLPPRVVPP